MQLAEQLHAAGVPVFPCRANKNPAVPKGVSWKVIAQQPPDTLQWPSELVGVPIPEGVVVIDLDTYKGVTREHVEALLGCTLPWDTSLIQTTPQGGQHYAFSVDWDVKFGSSLEHLKGLDTRTATKGYICTGAGYQAQAFGVFSLGHPETLPRLPETCRALLEDLPTAPAERVDLPTGDRDIENIREALRHVDPGTTRTEWVRIGLALRHHFHDEEVNGYALFDEWSAGELWADGCPENYIPEHMENQWSTFKPEGDTTIASLFYMAMQGGWHPPATFDTSLAFGPGACPASDFDALVERINESGSDSRQTEQIMDAIRQAGCNDLQATLLRNELKAALRSAKLLDSALTAQIDQQLTPTVLTAGGQYGKNHTDNADLFLQCCHPNRTLVRLDETWYAYDSKSWVQLPDATVRHQLAVSMTPSRPQSSTTAGTYARLCDLVHEPGRIMGQVGGHKLLFQNGVLDLLTGIMHPHSPDYFTTNLLPYNYTPEAQCPMWMNFLDQVFEGDQDCIALLQEWLGYMMSTTYDHQKVMLMLGPPRCGKGTIGRIMQLLVGDLNYSGGSLTSMATDSFLESLRTKTVMFSGDTAKNIARQHVDTVVENIKKISGNDEVSFHRMYKGTTTCRLPTRITLASNHVPRLFDDSGALASRLLVLPFDVSFLGREDLKLAKKLSPEIEGIASWSLQGLARLSTQGVFTLPAASAAETQYIAETYSPLQIFIDECCSLTRKESDRVPCEAVYIVYQAWAIARHEDHTLNRRPFVTAFKDATRGHGCRYGSHRMPTGSTERGFKGLVLRAIKSPTAAAFEPRVVN